MTRSATLADVVAVMEELYPSRWAEPGDPVGLTVGDPSAVVRRVLYAVDPVQSVVEEAVATGAELVVTHHPLLFRAVHTVSADLPKGRVVHDLIGHGIALFAAHTNADGAPGGVSESLATALGLTDLRPLVPEPADALDKIVTFVPAGDTDAVIDALAAAGAGAIGRYDRCAFVAPGEGTFRPGAGAIPAIGTVGHIEAVDERRVEMVLPRGRRAAVVRALRSAHPYEEPAFDVFELADWPGERGTGRLGVLSPSVSLGDFAERVAAVLPSTTVGVRVSGDLASTVTSVAVVGGAGDSLLESARASGVDVYVTSDLRHHPALEFREHPGAPALVDVPHWAAEWTWLPNAARGMVERLAASGMTVEVRVSQRCTDPWNHRAGSHQRSIS